MNLGGISQNTRPLAQLTSADFERFSQFALANFGLHFPEKRQTELAMGVRQAFAATTYTSLDEYFAALQDPLKGPAERERLANALTVGETYFFRDAGQFDALYNHVLPEIIARRRSLRTLRIWSAGCASGEEPYSIAILLRALLPDLAEWSITILATDINTQNLARARQGLYSEWAFREPTARLWRPIVFRSAGSQWELAPEVRRMVTFAPLNLASDKYPSFDTNTMFMDLVVCRNVTIYFPEALTRQVVDRFYESLVEGGWLVVGHSELSMQTYQRFQAWYFTDAVLYKRSGDAPQPKNGSAAALGQGAPGLQGAHAQQGPLAPQGPLIGQAPPVGPATAPLVQSASLPPPRPSPTAGSPGGPGSTTPRGGPAQPASTSPGSPAAPIAPPELFERGRELLTYGDSRQACKVLTELARLWPDHAPTCQLLGQANANLGLWAEAEEWCRRAIQLDKLHLEAYYTLALIHQHQGQTEAAIADLKKVVYIDQNFILGHFGLASLYRHSDRLPQAHKSLDNALRLLAGRPDDELVPGSGGITVVRLREAALRQKEQWGGREE